MAPAPRATPSVGAPFTNTRSVNVAVISSTSPRRKTSPSSGREVTQSVETDAVASMVTERDFTTSSAVPRPVPVTENATSVAAARLGASKPSAAVSAPVSVRVTGAVSVRVHDHTTFDPQGFVPGVATSAASACARTLAGPTTENPGTKSAAPGLPEKSRSSSAVSASKTPSGSAFRPLSLMLSVSSAVRSRNTPCGSDASSFVRRSSSPSDASPWNRFAGRLVRSLSSSSRSVSAVRSRNTAAGSVARLFSLASSTRATVRCSPSPTTRCCAGASSSLCK